MCVCAGKGLRKGEGDGAGVGGVGGGGGHWYNIIKIGWPSQGSACYCLFNRKKMACKNSRADVLFFFPLSALSANITKTNRRRRTNSCF